MLGRVQVRWQWPFPRLVVLEKYEKGITWGLRVLALIGVGSSLVAIPVWYVSFGVALLLAGCEQFLERSVFQYTTLYLQPMPDFEYEPDEWQGMGFILPQGDDRFVNAIALAFRTEDYARQFFDLIRAWNYGEDEDEDNNICLSFLWEDEQQYHVVLYPNPKRNIVAQAKEDIEEELRYEKYGKEHLQLIMQVVFCKDFRDYGSLRRFLQDQDQRPRPFSLLAAMTPDQRNLIPIDGIEPILKHDFKVAHWDELDANEFEKQFREARGF